MYLSKCIINGFKSFADKIEIDFEQGLSAIVGPNGCGKSNIYEAIVWVLGEQRPRSLRSSKMEDVIFNGSSSRSEVGMAEVTIVISDPDGQLMNSAEIQITRRLFRSGQSEYLINNNSCRLKDIMKLLANSGIGKNSYAFIGQGQVEQILQSRPQDLRLMFEDAAGISQYKEQKFNTEVQLRKNRDSITRIDDLIAELESDIESLVARAEKAIAHQELSTELVEKKRILLINEYLKSLQKLERITASIREEKHTLAINELEYGNVQNNITIYEANLMKLQEQRTNTEKDLIRVDNTVQNLQERLTELADSINTTSHSLKHRQNELNELTAEQQQLQSGWHANNSALQQLTSDLEENQLKINAINHKITEFQLELSHFNVSELEIQKSQSEQKIGSLQQRINDLSERIAASEEQQKDINKKLESINELTVALQEELAQIQLNKEQVHDELVHSNINADRLKELLHQDQQQLGFLNEQLEQTKEMQRNNASQLTLYNKLSNEYTGYYAGVKAIMLAKQQNKQFADILGVVAELIDVPKEYELAVSTVLGSQTQYLVSETARAATNAIRYLNEKQAGKATFLPLDRISVNVNHIPDFMTKDASFIGRAVDVIAYKHQAERAIKHLLSNVLIVTTVEAALRLTQQNLRQFLVVTLTGEVFSGNGTISGGRQKNNHNEELLARQRMIKQLEEESKEIIYALQVLQEKHQVCNNNYLKNQKDLDLTNSRSNELSKKYGDLEKKEYYTKTQIERITDENQRLTVQLAQLSTSEQKYTEQYEECQEYIEINFNNLSSNTNELQTARGLLSQLAQAEQQQTTLYAEIRLIENSMSSMKLQIKDAEAKSIILEKQQKRLEDEVVYLEKTLNAFRLQHGSNQESYDSAADKLHSLTQSLHVLVGEYDEASNLLTFTKQQLIDLSSEKDKIINRLQRFEKNLIEQQTMHKYTEAELYQANIRKDECTNDLGISVAKLDILKNELSKIEQQIAALGDVEYGAIADLKRRQERINFLKDQMQDLQEAEQKLITIIQDVDALCYERLAETVKQVNRNFVEVYTELFQGGNAEIQWEVEEDIFSSGITLTVSPPGKKVQNMSQLSGGEKALTAIALLLAFAKLRSSSFCIFDEVDAALDETNNIRLADYWTKIAQKTQVITITHSRHTMTHADYLYGVVMQEKGVSKVISVALDK